MDNQWMIAGPAFGFENTCHSGIVIRPCPQAIDGFGRKSHQVTVCQALSRLLYVKKMAAV
jgi:hypothetical protein